MAVVELAVISPFLILIFLGTLEMGRALHVQSTLQEAARAGCRMATLEGTTIEDIELLAESSLAAANIANCTITVTPTDFQAAEEGDAVTVSISTDYSGVSWFAPRYIHSDLAAACTMRVMRRPPADYPAPGPADGKKAAKKVAKKVGKKDGETVGKKANKKQQSLSWKKNKKT